MARAVEIELGGMKLPLRFEAINMFALTEHTGETAVRFLNKLMPQPGEDIQDTGIRCSDVNYVVPIVAAGLAHLPEYQQMPYPRLRAKICSLIDIECTKKDLPLIAACAPAMTAIIPVLLSVVIPPGKTLTEVIEEAQKLEQDKDSESPLAEAGEARQGAESTPSMT